MKIFRFLFGFFFKLLPKFSDFIDSDDWIEKKWHQILSRYIQFLFKKRFYIIKKGLFLIKKWKIQVIRSMIMLTRSLERNFNLSHHTGLSLPYGKDNWYLPYVISVTPGIEHRTTDVTTWFPDRWTTGGETIGILSPE